MYIYIYIYIIYIYIYIYIYHVGIAALLLILECRSIALRRRKGRLGQLPVSVININTFPDRCCLRFQVKILLKVCFVHVPHI